MQQTHLACGAFRLLKSHAIGEKLIFSQGADMSDWDSLIFLPQGGKGEYAEIAKAFRKSPAVRKPSSIIAIQHSHIEWVDIAASHLGLEAMSAAGHFLP